MTLIYLRDYLIFVYSVFNVILYVNFLMFQFYKSKQIGYWVQTLALYLNFQVK
jgi:hypothetical protein